MNHLLQNPVYHALLTGDHQLSHGTEQVKYFDEQVSPFVGFDENYQQGFSDLHDLLPAGREILYANPSVIPTPDGWQLNHAISGLQFIYHGETEINAVFPNVKPLEKKHIPQMLALAILTRPGPFGQRTIEFGSYYGIFENEKLLAMTGQRLHIGNFSELSAVCTHPDHTGNGYAHTLMQHQLQLILQKGQQPFLHVREDNHRAIKIYQQLGFTVSRPMNFYFMQKR